MVCTTFGVGVVTTSPANSTNMTQFKSTVLYSFANVRDQLKLFVIIGLANNDTYANHVRR